jgi:cellulose biosynthesis protein BcsQ
MHAGRQKPMESLLDGGPISEALTLLDPRYRPFIEAVGVALLVVWLASTTLNPILEFAGRLSGMWKALRRELLQTWERFFPPPPPPPEPPTRAAPIPVERTVWESRAPASPTFPKKNGIPIITVANMKGGVGKTTIVANLAPYFRQKFGKPILLIDFDYQGSLTQMVRTEAGYTEPDITTHVLITANYGGENPMTYAREMRRALEDVFIYTANYPFATIENNLLVEWLQHPESDLMYRLCRLLQRPEYQMKFGAILIDCPPRLTAGSINALCASTHLLVPTQLQDTSVQAAEYFLTQISRMKESVFPGLDVLGVVPSIIHSDKRLLPGEERALDRLEKLGRSTWNRENFVLFEGRIPRKADISNRNGVASLRDPSVALIFGKLGREIDERL